MDQFDFNNMVRNLLSRQHRTVGGAAVKELWSRKAISAARVDDLGVLPGHGGMR